MDVSSISCVFQFVGLEALATAILDMNPSFFHVGHRRKLLLLVISVMCFFIGLVMVTEVSSNESAASFSSSAVSSFVKVMMSHTGRTVHLPAV